jgi:hypothetical protein
VAVTVVVPDLDLKVQGKSRDISASGIFFYADIALDERQELELRLTLDYEFSVMPLRVACRVVILRVESDAETGQKGFAAAIQTFEFLNEAGAADSDESML